MRISFLPALFAIASAHAVPPDQVEFFEKRIRPVLAETCHECHGAEKQKGGLRLDSRPGWQKGGDTGAAIVPGKPAESLLLKAIRHDEPDMKMPAKRPKLDAAAIADFEKWIMLGAHDPRDEPAKDHPRAWAEIFSERKIWWSLQPVGNPAPPPVKNTDWARNDVDRFLLAKMENAGLAPTQDADPRTLIRRLAYVLTGLPPSPEEVEQFVQSTIRNPQSAIAEAADRLLASPRFGEHWARHWLDLVRYADSHGSEGDPEIPEAWRYRDYIIRAINDDVPVDALIREHIAGDQLPPRPNAAEGWNEAMLGLTHWRLVEHGFQPVDTRDEQVKTVDSQIDVLTKAFQGLTVSCARCHDHKFDAISQRDYTALAGILESSRPAMRTLDLPEKLDASIAALTAAKARVKAAVAEAWLAEAAKIPAHLAGPASRELEKATLEKERDAVSAKRDALRAAVLDRAYAAKGIKKTSADAPPLPIARWGFDSVSGEKKVALDDIGGLNAQLVGDAVVRDGRLILNGNGFARTLPVGRVFTEKTLEAWVKLAALDQRGGGVVTLEDNSGTVFDSIVFAENASRRWLAGSEQFLRSRVLEAPDEQTTDGFVHVAITYAADGTISVFRNGLPYGKSWKPANPPGKLPADSHLLFGLRHLLGKVNGHLRGEVDEARLYDRALSAGEIAASFRAGSEFFPSNEKQPHIAWTEAERNEVTALGVQLARISQQLFALGSNTENAWKNALTEITASGKKAAPDSASPTLTPKFITGPGVGNVAEGDFTIEPGGDAIFTGLRQAGVGSGSLTGKFGGIATTERFKITTDYISIHAAGRAAWCRLIVDGYPIGTNPIFPRTELNAADPRWMRIDVKYRKGSMAYVEFACAEDLTRREKRDAQSWFFVDRIVAHDGGTPPEPTVDFAALLGGNVGDAERVRDAFTAAITAWRDGKITEPQRALLDFFVRKKLLPTAPVDDKARALLAEFRRIEAAAPVPRRASGVFDADCYDAPLLTRGDHGKPTEPVPRGYLAALSTQMGEIGRQQSGRLQLANAITSPKNPLTTRVMANRVWLHVFGRGIVATPDNFGKMGELPTHPELLDHLATRLIADGWSLKKTLRTLVTSRAFALAGEPSAQARERDPGDALLSHFRVRRMEAESIRDSMLVLAGQLDSTMFGPPVPSDKPQQRRSIYLAVRRTALNPFLTAFDAPVPFSTLGRRDATNVPAQSLTLLNDPFVIRCAGQWAAQGNKVADTDARLRLMFVSAFSRPPADAELAAARRFLTDLGVSPTAWRDVAQSLFNLKEFIYLR